MYDMTIMKHWHFYFICCSWTTKIVLPLKESIRSQTTTLAARFNDIHPSLLLFLNRLRKITIDNRVENFVQNIHRKDYGENVVEITHDDKMDRWLVVKKSLDASKISLQVGLWAKSSLMYFILNSLLVFLALCGIWYYCLVPCPTNLITIPCSKMNLYTSQMLFLSNHFILLPSQCFFYLFKLKLIKSNWQAKSGVEVESTEIALAFPLRPPGQKKDSKVHVLPSSLADVTITCNNLLM